MVMHDHYSSLLHECIICSSFIVLLIIFSLVTLFYELNKFIVSDHFCSLLLYNERFILGLILYHDAKFYILSTVYDFVHWLLTGSFPHVTYTKTLFNVKT